MATQSACVEEQYIPATPALAIQEALAIAGSYLQAGDLAPAEQLCRRVLLLDPGSARSWFILGVVCQLSGRAGESVYCDRSSLRRRPANAEAWNNLGVSLQSLRRPEEAAPCFQQALRLEP